MKKDKELPEDTKKNAQDEIQKLTDKYIKKIDDEVAEKTSEIMAI